MCAKRKYARMGEAFEKLVCTKRACKWQGKPDELHVKTISPGIEEDICPKCGNSYFYKLLPNS